MIRQIGEPLVKSGILAVHTKDVFAENRTIDTATAAEYTRRVNQPDELRHRFLEIPTLVQRTFPTGDIVETHVPAGSYSQGALQVIAIRGEVTQGIPVEQINGRVPTRSIYEFPVAAQQEYFHQILGSMLSISERYGEYTYEPYKVLFTENAAQTVSDEHHRVARTIAEPHAQIWIANGKTEPFDQQKVPRLLRQERRLVSFLTDAIESGLTKLSNDLSSNGAEIPDFMVRSAPPYGYVMETRINRDQPVRHQANLLSTLMVAHHNRYKTEATRLTEYLTTRERGHLANKLLPQPSYKVFGTYSIDGNLEISIAPTVIAGTGVVEVLDRQIYRSPENDPYFQSDDAEALYYLDVANDLGRMSSH